MDKVLERMVDKKELSEMSGLTVSFIEKAMGAYGLPHYKIGRVIKFKPTEVSKWIDQRKRAS